ncbi:PrgI family mobile element protein [Clostridium disporicum]|uniref:PrgI family mobile element protein n=1 Tax=Clostridium disporicum TaxID=84024 RepID=UPI0034A5BC18
MAKLYRIPPDTSEEEKAIGGILTFTQFFWLLGGGVLGVFSYLLMYLLVRSHFIGIFFAVIVASSGLPFAFYKKKEMTFFEYLKKKSKFKKKSKKLINRRTY